MILLDTNLLTRLTSGVHRHGVVARVAVQELLARGEKLVIVPQNLYEFWAVATRPLGPRPSGENGLGLTVSQTSQRLQYFQRRFTLLHDLPELLNRWHELVKVHAVKGFRSHDVRFVAAMHCDGITQLLTFNAADFKDLGIMIIDPTTV
jgi:predicted nucleic acid-binding protein